MNTARFEIALLFVLTLGLYIQSHGRDWFAFTILGLWAVVVLADMIARRRR